MEDPVSVIILRTSDASKEKINVSMSCTLNELKDEISKTKLGPIKREHQRLFHLGKEWKSGRRTLMALGFAKFPNFTIHLHSTQPTTLELLSDDDDDVKLVVHGNRPTSKTKNSSSKQTNLNHPTNASLQPETVIVDLLDDDTEDSEQEVIVELVKPPSSSSTRQRHASDDEKSSSKRVRTC
jgi:hypothetical protein